jgi:hypothetical protein
MARKPKQQTKPSPEPGRGPATRWQIESGTRGVYVGSKYTERSTNWLLFSWSPDEATIVRFDDKTEAEEELARVRSFAANARLWEAS